MTEPPHRIDWELDGGTGRASTGAGDDGCAPFLGVLGMPPAEPGSTRRFRRARTAGTSTARSSSPGTTLYLPIPVDGALFSAGDGQRAQGDGEVSGTAIECPVARAALTLDVRDDLSLEWPCARIDGAWLTFGFDEHLGRAARSPSTGCSR